MYRFEKTTDYKSYDEFVEKNGGQYIQCSRWAKVKLTWKCSYYLGYEGDKIVLAALFMERKLPVVGKIVYCPAGAVMDYKNEKLLEEFSAFAKKAAKENGATCFIMDPPVSLRINGETKPDGISMHNTLTKLGYKLNKNLTSYTYKQPAQLFIPLVKTELQSDLIDELTAEGDSINASEHLKKCDKGVRYSIRLGTGRGLVAKSFDYKAASENPGIVKDFENVMDDTGERDSFTHRNGEYCLSIMKEFDGFSDMKTVYYDLGADKKLEEERQKRKTQCIAQLETAHEKKARQLNEEIKVIDGQSEHFRKRVAEVEEFIKNGGKTAEYSCDDFSGDVIIPLAGGLSIYYAGMGSCLFGGTKNVIRNETRSSHYLNYLRLCESIERGCKVHDLGYIIAKDPGLDENGTLAPFEPQDNFKGILDFKKSFGSDYHEFIGEYIIVLNKAKYYAYEELMPKAKHAFVRIKGRR